MPKSLYAGVDVSEASLEVAYRDANFKPVRSNKVFDNDPEGIRDLIGSLRATAAAMGKDVRIVVGMEATSNFHKVLERSLTKMHPHKPQVHVLNPYAVSQFKKLQLKVIKTDKLDAQMIAHFLISFPQKEVHDLPEGIEELKELTRLRRRYVEEVTRSKNRLRSLLRVHFPGYKKYLGREISNRLLYAFSAYGSPEEFINCGEDVLANTQVAYKHRIGEAFAQKLVRLAKTAPRQNLNQATALVIKWTAKRILDVEQQVGELDHQIQLLLAQYFPNNPISSIPGIGHVSAASILAEVGDINRFETLEKFIGYIGLYPIVWESGQMKARFRMTSKGNKMLKMTLLVGSAAARQFNPVIREYYDRLRARGKSKKAAGGAIARKLAVIIFTIWKQNEEWCASKAFAGMEKGQEMLRQLEAKKRNDSSLSGVIAPMNTSPVAHRGHSLRRSVCRSR